MKIGVDLGGSHIAIGVVNDYGIIVEKVEQRILSKEKTEICSFIENYIAENLQKLSSKYDISSIGIAIPGTVDDKSIIKSVNLGIENYNIVDNLKKRILANETKNASLKGLAEKIKIKNDAKCAALAENEFGNLKRYSRGLFLSLGTGIGGAVIINNQLLDTGNLPGMEIGHMVIRKDGLKCNCGNRGCFERYASMKAFKSNLRKTLKLDEKTSGKDLLAVFGDTSKKQLFGDTSQKYVSMIPENDKAKQGEDGKIDKIVNDFIENLSIGIANLVNIFEPEAIVIGGSFIYFEDILLDILKQNLINGPYLFNKRKDLIIKTAILGNDAGMIGASLI